MFEQIKFAVVFKHPNESHGTTLVHSLTRRIKAVQPKPSVPHFAARLPGLILGAGGFLLPALLEDRATKLEQVLVDAMIVHTSLVKFLVV